MRKTRLLFLIHDLGQGGAEKVLINLVNNLDQSLFCITLIALFGGGVNEKSLHPSIRYKSIFPKMIPGNSKLMKLFTPEQLHHLLITEHYDIEISFLEGPCARIISGANSNNTKLINWVHVEQHKREIAASSFRSAQEAESCYCKFDRHIFVSETVRQDFLNLFPQDVPCKVIYNTVETKEILEKSLDPAPDIEKGNGYKIVAVGTLKKSKGFDRLLRIILRLKKENYHIHLYLIGDGSLKKKMGQYVKKHAMTDNVTFLGYQNNPYKYVSKCNLFVCSSYAEGFSTAATEALIVGTPVCTVEVSGMKEMLGDHNEYGVIVKNSEEDLYWAIKEFLDNPVLEKHYRNQAILRGKEFDTAKSVKAVEEMLLSVLE